MRVGNLKNLALAQVLYHLNKFYSRGFAIVEERETPCACACGHAHHTIKKEVRLTLEEATTYVKAKYREANSFPIEYEVPPLPVPEDVVEMSPSPALEIPSLEATTPPRPAKKRAVRLIRSDSSWIRIAL